jgi:hypothetical protein
MVKKNAKQMVYRYNGDATSDEVEVDRDGEITVPERDQIVMRKDKRWKVVHVITEVTVAGPQAIPVVRVFLTDQL